MIYFFVIKENNTKNLLKNPAKGGIPAIESKISENVIINVLFFKPEEVQWEIYFGKKFIEVIALKIIQKTDNVRIR